MTGSCPRVFRMSILGCRNVFGQIACPKFWQSFVLHLVLLLPPFSLLLCLISLFSLFISSLPFFLLLTHANTHTLSFPSLQPSFLFPGSCRGLMELCEAVSEWIAWTLAPCHEMGASVLLVQLTPTHSYKPFPSFTVTPSSVLRPPYSFSSSEKPLSMDHGEQRSFPAIPHPDAWPNLPSLTKGFPTHHSLSSFEHVSFFFSSAKLALLSFVSPFPLYLFPSLLFLCFACWMSYFPALFHQACKASHRGIMDNESLWLMKG